MITGKPLPLGVSPYGLKACVTGCWKISDVLCLNVTRKIVLLSMVRNFLVATSFQFFRSRFLMYVLLYISSVIFVLPKP